ncbi:MAG: asparagine--tRNA ligase [Candidatus Shikimatogenerans bostrichidophilus]|nr:MAG: asparagine--tRNA ligase [Candidatus Shikimatogenerans bostrichidophilus]
MIKYYKIKDLLKKNDIINFINKIVGVKGWILFFRNNLFLEINDGTTIDNLQIIVNQKFNDLKKKFFPNLCLKIIGKVKYQKKNKNNIEIKAKFIKIYNGYNKKFIIKSILQNKYHRLSKIREQSYLRFRKKIFLTIFRIRHYLFLEIHNYLKKKDIIYISTPLINNNNAEGAGETFQLKSNEQGKDIFNNKAYLTVSGQLELESAMYGLSNVYSFGPVFRADNSNTDKHLCEFWMLEIEILFCKLKNIIKLSIKFIKYLLKKVLINCKKELNNLMIYYNKYRNKNINLLDRLTVIIKNKFIIKTYNQIIILLKKYKNNIINWGDDIGSIHEKILFNNIFKKQIPIIIYNYPKKIKPFYMKENKDKITTKSFDILFPFIGEIIGGSEREDNYQKLYNNIKEKKINLKNIKWYINLRKLGKLYHSGFGLGFERLIQYITGIKNIRDVIPFPIYPGYTK